METLNTQINTEALKLGATVDQPKKNNAVLPILILLAVAIFAIIKRN